MKLLWIALSALLMIAAEPCQAIDYFEDRTPEEFSVILFMTDDVADDVGFGVIQGAYDLARLAPANPGQGLPAGTPNIDSLRSQGLRFSNVFRNPDCASTRYATLSGLEAWQSGVWAGSMPSGYPTTAGVHFPEYVPTNYHTAMFGKFGASGDGGNPATAAVDVGLDYFLGRITPLAGDWFTNSAVGESILIYEGIAPSPWAVIPTNQGDYLGDYEHQDAADWIRDVPGQTGNPYLLFVWPNHAHQASYHIPPPVGDETVCAPETDQECVVQEVQWHDKHIGDIITAAKQLDPTMAKTLVVYASGDNGDGLVTDPNCLGGQSKSYLCQSGINADDFVIAYGDVSPGLRGGLDSTTPLQITDIFETVLDYTGTSGAVPDTNRSGLSFRNQVSPGSCTVGALCYDGLTRCVYVAAEEVNNRAPGTHNRRSVTCETTATDGFRYIVNADGREQYTYAFPDETNICTGAACDAATLEYRTTIAAHDSLPLPFTCLDAPTGTILCKDFEDVGCNATLPAPGGVDCDDTTTPSPLAGLESARVSGASVLFTGWVTDCSGDDCQAVARVARDDVSPGLGGILEFYDVTSSIRYCFIGTNGSGQIRVGGQGAGFTDGTVTLSNLTEYEVYLDYDRTAGDCVGTIRQPTPELDGTGTIVDTVTVAVTAGWDVAETYLVGGATEVVVDDLHVISGPL